MYSPKKIYQKGLYHIPIGSWLEFPLEVYLSVYGGAAFAIDVAAKGKTHVETLVSFEGDACGDAHAVAAIISSFVIDGFGQAFESKVGGAIVV